MNSNKTMTTTEMIDISVLAERASHNKTARSADMRLLQNLRNACDVFAHRSYFDFRAMHEQATTKGLKAKLYGIKIFTYCIMGRIMISISNDDHDYVSLCGGEELRIDKFGKDKSMGGLHGIDCDTDVALDMLELATDTWYEFYHVKNDEVFTIFEPDVNLRIR